MHFKNSVLLFLVVQFTKIKYSLCMDDICSSDDDTCMNPNFSGVGMIEKGKCSLTGILLRFHQLSMLECAKKCFITSQCTSINYRQNWKLCDLVMSNDDENEMADDSTCIRSNITTWQKSLAGKCADHNCKEGKRCQVNAVGNRYICIEAYCEGSSHTANAEAQEPSGDLDTGNEFICDNGYKMEGKPFAVSQSPGEWKVLFHCPPAKECGSNKLQFDGETTTCMQLVTTSGTTWEDARKHCQQHEGIGRVWIGLKDKTWMTGESFENIFGVTVQLNNYDGAYPSEVENSCGVLGPLLINKLQDENCNLRLKRKFLCEINI